MLFFLRVVCVCVRALGYEQNNRHQYITNLTVAHHELDRVINVALVRISDRTYTNSLTERENGACAHTGLNPQP